MSAGDKYWFILVGWRVTVNFAGFVWWVCNVLLSDIILSLANRLGRGNCTLGTMPVYERCEAYFVWGGRRRVSQPTSAVFLQTNGNNRYLSGCARIK